MKLTRSMKKLIRAEQEKMLIIMSDPKTEQGDWDEANDKYQTYSEMLKTSWKFTPDTMLVVGGNLLGIIMILNFERLDIVRSKAFNLLLRGRV